MSASCVVLTLALGISPLAPTAARGADPCECCAKELVEIVVEEQGKTEQALSALKTLRECPAETVKSHFPRLLRELTDPRFRRLVAMTLAQHGVEEGVEELRRVLAREPDLNKRLELASLLVSYGDPTGYPSVVEAIGADEPRVRRTAIGLLSRFAVLEPAEGFDVGSNLRKALQDSVPENRIEALNQIVAAVKGGLAHEGFEEAVERIWINDPEEGVRKAAERTLKLIDPENRRRLENLRRLLEQRKGEPPGSRDGNGVK